MLKEFDFEYSSKLINYKGFKIASYVIGNGDKVVFSFPSFPHSGLYYLWFLNHYKLDKIKFVTFDLPGWIGYSDDIFNKSQFDIEDYVNIAKQVIKEHGLTKFSLLGYSFGGALAIRLASELNDQVEKVVLVSAVFNSKSIQFTKELRALSLVKHLSMSELIRVYLKNAWKQYVPNLISEGFPQNYLMLYEGMINQIKPKILLDSLYSLFHLDWSKYLTALENKPLLIVNSRDEAKMFRKQAEELRHRFPEGKSIYIHGNHEDFLLKPKSEVVKRVVRFLET